MNNFIAITAGIATITTIGFASYQVGRTDNNNSAEEIKVNIVNSIDSTISSLPAEKRKTIDDILIPIKELITVAAETSSTSDNKHKLEIAEKGVKDVFHNLSLVSYKAKDSPFIPPVNKVQLLCKDNFSFTYRGQYEDNSLRSEIKVNDHNRKLIEPGDMIKYTNNDVNLEITYMEYRKDLKGPVIKYVCK